MKRSIFCTIICVGLVTCFLVALSGCHPFTKQNTFTITMSLGEQEWQVFRQEIFPLFEKEHQVTINAYQIESGQLVTKLEALQGAGKSEIDLFAQDNMELALLISRRLVQDLSESESQIPSQVLPGLISSCKFNGRLMFMPFRPNVQIVYYNKDALEKYQCKFPESWEDLLGVAKKLKEGEKEPRVLLKAFGGNPTATQCYEFILQAGGNPYEFDDEGCVAAFSFLQSLWPYVSEESKRAKWDTTNEILARQQAFVAQNWPFGITILIQDYKLPFISTHHGWKGPAGEFHVIGGDVFGIPKNSRNKELALAFIRFMQSKEIQEILVSKLGWPSIRSDAYAKVEEWQRPHYESVVEALRHGVFRENVPWWPVYAKYVTEAFREIVIESNPVEPTLRKYKELLNKDRAAYQ